MRNRPKFNATHCLAPLAATLEERSWSSEFASTQTLNHQITFYLIKLLPHSDPFIVIKKSGHHALFVQLPSSQIHFALDHMILQLELTHFSVSSRCCGLFNNNLGRIYPVSYRLPFLVLAGRFLLIHLRSSFLFCLLVHIKKHL